jgi:hypothetical protein
MRDHDGSSDAIVGRTSARDARDARDARVLNVEV